VNDLTHVLELEAVEAEMRFAALDFAGERGRSIARTVKKRRVTRAVSTGGVSVAAVGGFVFAGLHGPAFYGLAPNAGRITLEKADAPLSRPAQIETGAGPVAVFDPGFPLLWRVRDEEPRP